MTRGQQTRLHVTAAESKQSVLREGFERPTRPLERHKSRKIMATAEIIPIAKWLANIRILSSIDMFCCTIFPCCGTIPYTVACVFSPSPLSHYHYTIFHLIAWVCVFVSKHPSASLHVFARHHWISAASLRIASLTLLLNVEWQSC